MKDEMTLHKAKSPQRLCGGDPAIVGDNKNVIQENDDNGINEPI
jgi:hypothetical protein